MATGGVGKLKRLLPTMLRAWIGEWRGDRRTARSPARAVLENRILPAFAATGGPMLWVGCRRYTRRYPAVLEAHGGTCSTIDIDPRASRWGRPGRHVVGDLLQVDHIFPADSFDAVLCNGVLGYGIDDPEQASVALAAMARVIRPQGWLLLGWNTDRVDDPLTHGPALRWFTSASLAGLEQRIIVPGHTHVFDLMRRRPVYPS
jgi:hypothetical protein